ncbi:MAG: M64 family metallopeptidase, partial [Planctomycetota bacterium JB042]
MHPTPLSLLVALVIVSSPAPAEEVDDLLAKAEAAGEAGRYGKADSLYRKIVEEAPGSEAARIAEERLAPNAWLRTVDLEINGDPDNRIDIFVLGDGYTREPKFQKLFDQGARETLKYFEQAPVFRRYRKFMNFHAMNIASHEDGVDARGKDYDTALGAYESGASQGQVAVRHQDVARWLRLDPRAEGYAICLVRLGTLGTGGGGIAVIGGVPSNTVIHEWGHAFANLLDEYTSDVGYTGPAPRGINVSNTDDPDLAPWKHWLDARKKGVGMRSEEHT